MEMPKPTHALLALMVGSLLLKIQQLPLSMPIAIAQTTPMEPRAELLAHALLAHLEVPLLLDPILSWVPALVRQTTTSARQRARLAPIVVPVPLVEPKPLLIADAPPTPMQLIQRVPSVDARIALIMVSMLVEPLPLLLACAR
jgi:hypothetical protein